MKARNINIYLLLTLIASMAAVSCADDTFVDYGASDASGSNLIRFDVSSGFDEGAMSRSGVLSEDEELDPVVLAEGTDTLYLHRYVASESERATGRLAAAMSRAAEVNNIRDFVSLNKGDGFRVAASYSSDDSQFFPVSTAKPLEADKNNCDVWYVPDHPAIYRYWPDGRELRFNAYAPANAKFDRIDIEGRTVTFGYTVPVSTTSPRKDAEAQPDIMFASSVFTHVPANPIDCDLAPLNFRHALSAIKFAVRDVANGEIVDISIKGVHGSGSCTFNPDYAPGENESFNVGGLFTWSDLGDTKDYTQTYNYETKDSYPNPAPTIEINTAMPEKTFMLIPQEIPEDAMLEITFKSGGQDKKLRGKLKTNEIPLWEAGKEYIYTISTTSENWTYVFEAIGNEAGGTGNIYVYSPGNVNFSGDPDKNIEGLGNTAYFDVVSYRYRTNNPDYKEYLPWSASHGGSYSYSVEKENDNNETPYPEGNPLLKEVTAKQWITDNFSTPLAGKGSISKERHDLTFLPHYITTNWDGDQLMQGYKPYDGFDENKPYDLSTFGGERLRTTANCYIVDRGGWYMFPMVYGNAIKEGTDNQTAYKSNFSSNYISYSISQGKNTFNKNVAILKNFVDYNDEVISDPWIKNINSNYRAMLIWQDAYTLIEDCELFNVNSEWMIRFFIDKNNLQQGNAIIALLDPNDNVVWSWHIWATEHWNDSETRLPHVYDPDNHHFTNFQENRITGFRERGDVAITHNQPNGNRYYMSPYNLGWCDPKSVRYLKRKNEMVFVQYLPDGNTLSGKDAKLPIIQDGVTIDYKYANNTYYQWGRKDPMRGFYNNSQKENKKVFGTRLSRVGDQGNITIGIGIRNPNIFYGNKGGSNRPEEEDWLRNDGYPNLWNNAATLDIKTEAGTNADADGSLKDAFWSHAKTVYDPCPAGYMVPNAGVWHFVRKADSGGWSSGSYADYKSFDTALNGVCMDPAPDGIGVKSSEYYKKYKVYGTKVPDDKKVADDKNALFFHATGNRWWTSDWIVDGCSGGDNMGQNNTYAWSSKYIGPHNASPFTNYNVGLYTRGAWGLALGCDVADDKLEAGDTPKFDIIPQFSGRRAMGRPVRAIREP